MNQSRKEKKALRAQKKAQFKEIEKIKYRDMTEQQKKVYLHHEVRYWAIFLSVVLSIYLILTFVIQIHPVFVKGDSMNPTFEDGNLTLSINCFYEPKNSDVIVFKSKSLHENLIKRIIATEGQTVYIDYTASKVYVDDKALTEDYTRDSELFFYEQIYTTENPCTVPEGYVFVMGDNRNNSLDSRSSQVGLVKKSDILGKVVFGGNK